jgi:proline dehydrogenase
MGEFEERWCLPNLQSAVRWCEERNAQGLRCILDVLGEYAKDKKQALRSVEAYISCVRAIEEHSLDASLALKLTSIGATFDLALSRKNVETIANETASRNVGFEIDMEGRGLVSYTLDIALQCAQESVPPTLALQAYLDRTPNDLLKVIEHKIKPRIVKGTYVGDATKFEDVQESFKALVEMSIASGAPFSVGTHDPELIEWLKRKMENERDRMEFGFLKGLSDATKIDLANAGWRVAEYVPFGSNKAAYEARRLKYLRQLDDLGRVPLP